MPWQELNTSFCLFVGIKYYGVKMVFGLFSKGTMDIKIEKLNFAHGEMINGNVSMQLKSPIAAR